ncbi:phage tail tube protein [Fulvimarina sp. 2208YS6-2-32]|uniref:Phage tail tube protein n=1 Tax=Fulvimarina uroteuthidis TaxID=3098149 RepID=A0ABU5I6Z1_9HYPH|nr:phage tail tube protein [Fulvimarina sp. 2208YS6-2-32]MDY8111155.1 phage tail tube protein [Fulvimarina sp. 2208YS6-2-32]
MGNQASKRTRFYIGTPCERDADMTAIATWTEVLDVTGFDGDIGDESELISYEVYGEDNRVRKLKGTRNAGNVSITVARLPNDAGQAAMRAGELADSPIAFRCDLANGDKVMFPALVMSAKRTIGDDVVRISYPLELTDDVTEVAAA